MQRNSILAVLTIACTVASSVLIAQRGPVQDPLVRENATVKLAPPYLCDSGQQRRTRAERRDCCRIAGTLVIDPGLGRRNGETVLREVGKVSKNSELFIGTTHFHAEHTTGYVAFPSSAKLHQLHRPGSGVRTGRHADGADVLRAVARDG